MTYIPAGKGTGRRLALRDTPTRLEASLQRQSTMPMPTDEEGIREYMQRLLDNPVEYADRLFQRRHYKGTTRVQRNLSSAKTLRQPMLNADRDTIARGLAYKEKPLSERIVKDSLYETLVVKPVSAMAAKAESPGGFWGERRWCVYRPRYARGFMLVTDKGSESRVFPTFGELKAAIRRSGWEIIR